MTTRQFLTDDQLDAILDTLPSPDTMPVATLDQVDAAARDMSAMSHGIALAALSRGRWAYLGVPPQDIAHRRRILRPVLKMLLAAFSAGPTQLCDHTRQIRPVMLSCDPPSLVCMEPACMAKVDQHAKTAGFRWDHQCDGCGAHTEVVTPYLTRLGPLSISGHLCQPCVDAVIVDEVQAVSRKSPCPCGSGCRYKHCHGNARV